MCFVVVFSVFFLGIGVLVMFNMSHTCLFRVCVCVCFVVVV